MGAMIPQTPKQKCRTLFKEMDTLLNKIYEFAETSDDPEKVLEIMLGRVDAFKQYDVPLYRRLGIKTLEDSPEAPESPVTPS